MSQKRSAYFGSVRFFKHLILTTVALLILVPTVISAVTIRSNLLLREELSQQAEQSTQADQSTQVAPDQVPVQGLLPSAAVLEEKSSFSTPELLSYQKMYPQMKTTENVQIKDSEDGKCVYLTFDDGPSALTAQVLDILKQYDIKATFFVVYKGDAASAELYKRIVDEGHTLGIHSASHDYDKIYQSVDAYLDDFAKLYDYLYLVTGVHPEIFRFPGGSLNSYNQGIYKELIAEMLRRGFVYFDWNVSAQDAASKVTSESCVNSVMSTLKGRDRAIVLMHDSASKQMTVAALPHIIEELQKQGYHFSKLDRSVRPVDFSYTS